MECAGDWIGMFYSLKSRTWLKDGKALALHGVRERELMGGLGGFAKRMGGSCVRFETCIAGFTQNEWLFSYTSIWVITSTVGFTIFTLQI